MPVQRVVQLVRTSTLDRILLENLIIVEPVILHVRPAMETEIRIVLLAIVDFIMFQRKPALVPVRRDIGRMM